MIKKVLFILTSVLLGFLLITNGYYICFYNVFQKFTEEVVEEGNYLDAGKYYSYSFDYENAFSKVDFEGGAHIDMYSALNIYARDVKKEDETKVQYETIESTIQFSMFNLPEDFALADPTPAEGETAVKGGVKLLYGEKSVFFEFMPRENESYYSYSEYYNFLPFTIHYDDYVSKLTAAEIPLDSTTTAVEIYDGNNDTVYTLDVKAALFNTSFHNNYYETITRYNNLKKADALSGETSSEYESIINSINKITTDNKYAQQHNVEIIFKSGAFIWRLSLMVGIFLVLDFAIGFLLFRKKKPGKFVPRKPMMSKPTTSNNSPKLNYQPEQFSRKDIIDATESLNEEVVSEENISEEVVEETLKNNEE